MGTSRLKVILAERDIRLKELAGMTNISYGALSKIANGRRPQLENAYRIADALNLHVNNVFPDYYSYAALYRKKPVNAVKHRNHAEPSTLR